jgi:hypothetical protein
MGAVEPATGAEEIRKSQPSHCASFTESADTRLAAGRGRFPFLRAIGRYNRARAEAATPCGPAVRDGHVAAADQE